jgi:hypothetical protein
MLRPATGRAADRCGTATGVFGSGRAFKCATDCVLRDLAQSETEARFGGLFFCRRAELSDEPDEALVERAAGRAGELPACLHRRLGTQHAVLIGGIGAENARAAAFANFFFLTRRFPRGDFATPSPSIRPGEPY